MSRFNRDVSIEVVKKKRRRAFDFSSLDDTKNATTSNESLTKEDSKDSQLLDLLAKADKDDFGAQKTPSVPKVKTEEIDDQQYKDDTDNLSSSEHTNTRQESSDKATTASTATNSDTANSSSDTSYSKNESDTKSDNTGNTSKKIFKKTSTTIKEINSSNDESSEFKGKLKVKHPINKAKYDLDKKRTSNKLLIQNIDSDDYGSRRSLASIKREKAKRAKQLREGENNKAKQMREVILPEFITVAELASRMAEKASDVVREFMRLGSMVSANQTIDADTAEIVIEELGHKVKKVADSDIENILEDNDAFAELLPRPPVVTVVGHVDHGKTSLLDALRRTDVTSGEAGGITQHIGAYQIKHKSGKYITFIDTPGHEAFSAMRSRGVTVTDVVILVVAADDGVKEQTIEAINHAKAAKAPIIVAINKMDKEGADPNRVATELLNHGLVAESMGGDIMTVEVSALQKLNLEQLEEAILLQAEMLELKEAQDTRSKGTVIESKIDKSKGVLTTLLIQKGTLQKGDLVVAGNGYGRVKTIENDKGQALAKATPSMPVEITGLNVSPNAGDTFAVVEEEKQAREICEYRDRKAKEKKNASREKISLEDLLVQASSETGSSKALQVIVKSDVHGSMEAISGSLENITKNNDVRINVLHKATGGINESDISLAAASNAIILGFNVRANSNAKLLGEQEGVDIRYYSIIYELVDDIKRIISGMLDPIKTEKYLGKAEIRQVFNISKFGKIAGTMITDGSVKRGANVRLLRDDVVIHDGKLKTLKRFKDDVKEASTGYECGMAFENYEDIKEGDIIEAYEVIETQRVVK